MKNESYFLNHDTLISTLKLTKTLKFNHYNNYFQESRFNLFKTWKDIRKIMNITKKSKQGGHVVLEILDYT